MKHTYTHLFILLLPILFLGSCQQESSPVISDSGQGGSLARMTISGDYIYAVDHTTLKTVSIANLENPEVLNSSDLGFGIETIFAYNQKLFIGSQDGMYIFSLEDPTNPEYISKYIHVFSCDPVVVNDTIAYVTLRGGWGCRTFFETNQLEIISVADPENPVPLAIYPMEDPRGLSIQNNLLYLCDGPGGLKIFDVTDPYNIDLINTIGEEIDPVDIIVLGEFALVIATGGFHQYNISDPLNPVKLSTILKD